ncbi:MAG: lamin tail domain-containing protein, partial [Balneolales bacterium]|nr:lamin tail domain-containing protein [Balneolales bacterium]
STTILEDTTVFLAGKGYRVNIVRDVFGNWQIGVGEGYHGELKNSGHIVTDNTHSSSAFFGVLVGYTASRTDDFYFDFKIEEPAVVVEPVLLSEYTVADSNQVALGFTRDIDLNSVTTTDFMLNRTTRPQSFSSIGMDSITLIFADPLESGEHELSISGIESFENDTLLEDTTVTFFLFDDFEPGDVLINEFLKDPPPGSGIPEYVELINTTPKFLNLRNWQIGDNNSLTIISVTDLVLHPDTLLVFSGSREDLTRVFGEGNYIDVSLPSLNNSGDQIRVFNGVGTRVDSLEYTSGWGGVDVALERRDLNLSSSIRANWGNAPEGIGSPGQRNKIERDTSPPNLESWEFLNNSTLLFVYDEEILEGPAEDVENFSLGTGLDNDLTGPDILSVEYHQPDSIVVFFEFVFPGDEDGENYMFGIKNQQDVFGNINPDTIIEFEFRDFETAQPGEVAINEFMYDPADDYTEFVELYNHSPNTFNLKEWTFNDNSGTRRIITGSDFFLLPGKYVVLAADSTIAETFPGTSLIAVSSFPALNNSEDDLVLRNEEGMLIDSLTYASSWGGDEVSLERRTVDVSAVFMENWRNSPSENSGTPGRANETLPDTSPPGVIAASFPSDMEIQLVFDEQLFLDEPDNPDNYYINNSFNPSLAETKGDTVLLVFDFQFKDGDVFSLELRNIKDLFGNSQTLLEVVLTYTELGEAKNQGVVINEILYRRFNELSPEFVELYNRSDASFDLSGWELVDAGGNDAIIPEGTILRTREYLVLTDREDFAEEINHAIYLSDFPSLNDRGDELVLRNSAGIIIDSLFYEDVWGGNIPGISLERIDPENASNDASNWATSKAPGGFSAGMESSVFENDTTPPEIIFSSLSGSVVRVVFSEYIVTVPDETEYFVNGQETFPEEGIESSGNELLLTWTPGLEVSTNSLVLNEDVKIRNVSDVKGNRATEISSPIASLLKPGSIVINEIMFDPLADSDDNLPDQTEYIELYNPTDEAISLEGVFLHDAPNELNEIRSLEPVTSQYKWIQPDGYFLIYSEDETNNFNESQTARYFELQDETDQFTMQIERSGLSLASSGDAIYLADSTGTTIDSVFYDETWQNPNLIDTDGIALERIDPNGGSNDENNWSSSTTAFGGTPLMENSIFQEAGAAPDNVGISFSPNPFSPDDDGFEDNLFINYTLDASGYMLRVRIFDRYGREVRKLADGVQAGFEGSLIWDGLTDDRTKNRIGMYIVLFEAYNSADGTNRTFKETIVLARMF